MNATKLVAIHDVEVGPHGRRVIVKSGEVFPNSVEIDAATESELVRYGAIKRVPLVKHEGGAIDYMRRGGIATADRDSPSQQTAAVTESSKRSRKRGR